MDAGEFIKAVNFTDESGSDFVLKYFLAKRNHGTEDDIGRGNFLFCITVEKHCKNLENTSGGVEKEDTDWFAANDRAAARMVDLLVKHTVTPMTLHSVADDWMMASLDYADALLPI